MTKRKIICSQQQHCLTCPISIKVTGKECRLLTQKEIKEFTECDINEVKKNSNS